MTDFTLKAQRQVAEAIADQPSGCGGRILGIIFGAVPDNA
jgi:hypothetical protein